MNKKFFTLILALSFILGGMVNAQHSIYNKAIKMSKDNSTSLSINNQSYEKGTAEDYKVATSVFVPTKTRTKSGAKGVFLNETFDTGIPATWTINNTGAGTYPGWYWLDTDENTNLQNFAIIYSDKNGSGNLTEGILTSPAVDVTAATVLYLDFDTRYNFLTVGESAKVEVFNGTEWVTLITWVEDHGTADVPEHVQLNLTPHINAALQVRFNYTDANKWVWYWMIDNVQISSPKEHDLGIIAISPTTVQSGHTVNPMVTVKNFGGNEEALYTVVLTDGGTYTSTVNVTTAIAIGAEAIITMDDWTPADGTFTLTATVTVAEDGENSNDELDISCDVLEYINAYVTTSASSIFKTGIFSIPISTFTEQAIVTPMIRGYAWKENTLYALTSSGDFGTVNTTDGTYTLIGATGVTTDYWTNLACDPTSGIIYGMHISGSYPEFAIKFYSIDETTGLATLAATSSHAGTAAMYAFDNNGTLYAIEHQETGNGKFYSVDITNGDMTLIGDMGGIVSSSFQGMAWDFDNNVLYYQATGDPGEFQGTYSMNTTTGAATLVDATPASVGQVMGFVFPYQLPGAYANFTVTNGTDPIQGANVNVNNHNYTTDALGQVSAYLLVGDYPYSVTAFGYEVFNSSTDIAVVDGVDVAVPVTMTALDNFDVTFNIKNNLDAPLNAEITVYFEDNVYQTATAVAGTYTMAGIPVGSYTFNVAFDSYITQTDLALEVVDAAVIKDVTLLEVINDPYGLEIEVIDNTAEFSWNNTYGFSDDFESYDDFALEFSPWTLIDVDGKPTFNFSGITFTNSGLPMAGIIFNPTTTDPVMDDSFAYSGDKYVAVFNPNDGSPCNDWIIAPKTLINPNFQVSFWARGGNENYSEEKFQVAVSTTDATPASFTTISPVITCPANSAEWVQYTYTLSAYAGQEVYVGIHVISADQFYFCLDDFAIESDGSKAKAIDSYSIYLDDLVTPVATDVPGYTYTFTELTGSLHTAGVQTVYETGASNIVTIDFDITVGINNVKQITAVYPNPSTGIYNIITENATVIVTDITGRVILTKDIRNNGHIDLSAQPNGIYFLNIGASNLKVVKQ